MIYPLRGCDISDDTIYLTVRNIPLLRNVKVDFRKAKIKTKRDAVHKSLIDKRMAV